MKTKFISVLCGAALLAGCNIYRPYQRPEVDTQGLYRDPRSATDTLSLQGESLGELGWEEIFTDPCLQHLIRTGLERNGDLQSARLRVEQAEASLLSARLAYTPSLNLAPQGGVSSFDKSAGKWTYTLPAVASWEVDIFGRTLNAKRGAKAALYQSEAYRQAVQTQVIASIANCYYTLLMLDKQLALTEQTSAIWKRTVETMKGMYEGAMVTRTAVAQSEANSHMIEATIPDLRQSIRETENALSLLLLQAPQRIERGTLDAQRLPAALGTGVPVQLLANRPDVMAAEMALASAYYVTNQARAAFYPQLSLTGTFGWTNDAGSMVINPAKMIASAVASLVQPIFNKGANTARLRIAKAQQQEALIAFQQTLLNAGSEVSNALFQYESAQQKIAERTLQIASLEKAVETSEEVLRYYTGTYLEVLTAQQSLLSAQLNGIADEFQRMQAVVNLFHALGGGRNAAVEPPLSTDKQ